PRPTTMRNWSEAIRLMSFFASTQFQGGETDQHEDHRDDPEAHDDVRLGPAFEFEVVVNWRHAEHPLAGQLEGGDLDYHREGFHDEHLADDEQHDFLADNHRDGAQRRTQGQRTDVAHEHLRRVGVEPQETQAGTNQRAAKHDQLASARNIRNQQVFGEAHVTRQVAEDAQCAAHQHGGHNRQTVETVGEVHRIARTDNDEVSQHDETGSAQRQGGVLEHGHDQRGFNRILRSHEQENRRAQTEHR